MAWQLGKPCRATRLGFKRRATAVLKSNLIRSIEFGTAVARRLKRALESQVLSASSQELLRVCIPKSSAET